MMVVMDIAFEPRVSPELPQELAFDSNKYRGRAASKQSIALFEQGEAPAKMAPEGTRGHPWRSGRKLRKPTAKRGS
jgi:hypothetical protein